MKRIALVLLVVLSLLPATAGRAGEDPVKWDKSFVRAIRDHVRKLVSLAKFCNKEDLNGSAWTIRQLALRWHPDDKELLEDLGYRLNKEGEWAKDLNSREKLRKTWDTTPSKKAAERDKKLDRARKSATRRLCTLGKRATEAAAAGDEQDWNARARRAWRAAVEIDPGCEKAHRGLGSKQVDGRYVLDRWAPTIRTRVALRESAKTRSAQEFPTSTPAADPRLAQAGVTAHGAQSGSFFAYSQYGPGIAASLAVWSRRAAADLEAVHGLPNPPCGGTTYSLLALQDEEAWKKALVSGFGKSNEEVDKDVERGVYGIWAVGNAFVYYTSNDAGGTAAFDAGIQSLVRWAARSEGYMLAEGESAGVEDWLGEALALDVVFRLTGQAIATFVSDEGYRDSMRDSPEMNRWQAVSRLAVERDDDIPMRVLCRLRLNQLKTRHTAKAYTFLQFLRERDIGEAKAFVRAALGGGAMKAIQEVYGRSPESMDKEYAAWIRGTYQL